MKRIALIILQAIFALMPLPLHAQTSEYGGYRTLADKERVDSLFNAAMDLINAGEFNAAINQLKNALDVIEKSATKNHPDYAIALTSVGDYQFYYGDYNSAITTYSEVLDLIKINANKSHPLYLDVIMGLADSYNLIGENSKALRYASEAIILKDANNITNPDYVYAIRYLTNYYCAEGNYNEAIKYGKEALAIIDNSTDATAAAVVAILNTLTSCYMGLGDYAEAYKLSLRALEIIKASASIDSAIYSVTLGNLASYFNVIGNYGEAIRLCKEALIHATPNTQAYVDILCNLASFYGSEGDDDIAIQYLRDALELQKTLNLGLSTNVDILRNLAILYRVMGKYNEAIEFGTQVVDILRPINVTHPDYVNVLNQLAFCNYKIGNIENAIRLATEAKHIIEENWGNKHPDCKLSLFTLISCYLNKRDLQQVKSLTEEINNLNTDIVLNNFVNLSTPERLLFWDIYKNWFFSLLPKVAHNLSNPEMAETLMDATLLSKGILLNTEIEMSKLIAESGDPELIALFNDIRARGYEIDNLLKKPITERYCDVDSLSREKAKLERQLADRSKVYGDFTRNMRINWHDVQEALGNRDVAIEFLSFPIPGDSIIYTALVVDKKMQRPVQVHLFNQDELMPYLSYQSDESKYKLSPELSNLVWGKLLPYISNARNLYFAPAGELYNIPIESILSRKDCPGNLYRLSSTREIAQQKKNDKIAEVAIYGGIKYDTSVDKLIADSKKYPHPEYAQRDISWLSNPEDLREILAPLPGTELEAEQLCDIMHRINITPYFKTGAEATEASFKALGGKRTNLIHMATHGFYWTEDVASRENDLRLNGLEFLMYGDIDRKQSVEDKALTRSGLLLAGVENALYYGVSLPEGVDDGILTAKEISQLDLRGLDLVVLSACQTGLGDVTGDGVFGLQRGFKKAGANTLLMSLWSVNDKATQMLMTRFYENIFLHKMSKYDSLKEAQKYLRDYKEFGYLEYRDLTDEEKDEVYNSDYMSPEEKKEFIEDGIPVWINEWHKPFADPKYWAAFILLDALN